MSVSQAIAAFLSGSGLGFSFTNPKTVTITGTGRTANADAANDTTFLEPIVVNGETGNGNGYVAGTSAAGTKTQTPIVEVPQTINVITRKQMDDRSVTDF